MFKKLSEKHLKSVLASDIGADVRYLDMAALTKGELRSSFWVVDRKHMYIGSAVMDWRSLSKVITNTADL